MSLHTGTNPVFYSDDDHTRLPLPYPDEISFPRERNRVFDGMEELDDEIVEVWDAMANFCSLINLSAEAGGRIRWELFFNTMTAVMYRLIHMSFNVGSVNEAIRLGLLGLSSHVFLQWKVVRTTYVHLRVCYRICLDSVEDLDSMPTQVSSWLLIIGAVSVFEQSDMSWLGPGLRKNVVACRVDLWDEMTDILDSLLWIPLVREKAGKDFYDSVFAPEPGSLAEIE